jgi:pimeloyl-ACP methyl ester carboxylesterase
MVWRLARGRPAGDESVTQRAALILLGSALTAQVYPPGPQVVTFFSDVDDSDQPYALYVPKHFDTARKYPLVISLHGAGSNHRLNLRRVFGKGNLLGETDADATRFFPPFRDVDFVVASPLARGTLGFQGLPEKEVYDVLDDVRKRLPNIDEDRIYLTGLSMGGGGALWLGLTRPDLWAAIAAVCPAPPQEAEGLAGNALNLPVHLFHGALDPVVPVSVSRGWQRRLLDLEVKADYVEYPNVRHNAWDTAYKDGAIFDWFAQFRRNRYPERVRYTTSEYRYASAYWVEITALTPGTPASIDARFTSRNKLDIQTHDAGGFRLKVDGHPMYSRTAALTVRVDGATRVIRPGGPLVFGKAATAALSGPIGAAFSTRHIYVYGTEASGGDEDVKRRREIATTAAQWSTPRYRAIYSPRIVSDKEVRQWDIENANLILFGTKETNALVARFAPQLPFELNAGAADYGLLFIAPLGNRYVVVNSGLPWWTGAAAAKRPGLDFVSPLYRTLLSFGDFILFRGSLEDVIAEGRFDSQWKAPPELAAKMKTTGAVK